MEDICTSESLSKALKLVLDIAGIKSVIVFGETIDKISDFWNKVQIGSDWANLDAFRCCYLQDFRYFMLDDESISHTHVGRKEDVDSERFPKCQSLKNSYFSIQRTLISDTNLD